MQQVEPADEITVVLKEVPSAQPLPPQLEQEPSPGAIVNIPFKWETATERPYVVRLRLPPKPPASAPPPSYPFSAWRGILCLHTPPKLARVPALRRLPPCTSELPTPQWVPVSLVSDASPSISEVYRAPSPALLAEPDCQTPSLFQDAEEQEESSTAGLSWADIMDCEEQEEADCATTQVTSSAPPLAPTMLTITVATSGDQQTIVAPSAPSAAPTAFPPAAPLATPPVTLTTAPDTCPDMRDTDISHVVRLAPAGQVEYITDSLMSTYQTDIVFA